ncbi:ABC transporter ATP-binding protein [Sediminispirochaeta bajacaliforniensis]|uniref:ABC transporter ATP-binding protein n=1 Tax=Sediminispirochaeta bajacaliforniensis TaxID=148 RepID=UPI0003646781|nr:ABC transporter ATP-binding protein [Sediminispirochaeta bajacaliforniensis]
METNEKDPSVVLSVEELRTYFFMMAGVVKAVDGVSFSLRKGETLGIVGESGSGKSMTALSIMNLIPKPSAKVVGGRIMFEEKNLLELKQKEMEKIRGKDISMIFQDPMTSIDPVFPIGKQMIEVIRSHMNLTPAQAKERALHALRLVGIPDVEKRFYSYAHEFSGGMRQRVIIAMAIVCESKLIIADEPTTALDVTVQAQVLNLLKELQKRLGTPMILITHNICVIWEMCDTVMVMYAGKTVEHASVASLYETPLHPYTWGLLDSVPRLNQDTSKPLAVIEAIPSEEESTGDSCCFYDRCPYRKKICLEKSPRLKELSKGHFVACHLQESQEVMLKREGGSN